MFLLKILTIGRIFQGFFAEIAFLSGRLLSQREPKQAQHETPCSNPFCNSSSCKAQGIPILNFKLITFLDFVL